MGGVQRELGMGGKGEVVCHARLLPLSQFDEKIGRDEVCCGRWEGVERERPDRCLLIEKGLWNPFPKQGRTKTRQFLRSEAFVTEKDIEDHHLDNQHTQAPNLIHPPEVPNSRPVPARPPFTTRP